MRGSPLRPRGGVTIERFDCTTNFKNCAAFASQLSDTGDRILFGTGDLDVEDLLGMGLPIFGSTFLRSGDLSRGERDLFLGDGFRRGDLDRRFGDLDRRLIGESFRFFSSLELVREDFVDDSEYSL